jgi:glutaredoxin
LLRRRGLPRIAKEGSALMITRRTCLWLSLGFGLFMQPAAAAPPLRVYLFGATHCPLCQKALSFLQRTSAGDARFTFRDYDIERSSAEAELFLRVVVDIGIEEPVVPIVIIGPHVLLGFDDDATSGPEIMRRIEQCQTEACPDFVAQLEALGPAASGKRVWQVSRK